MRRVAQTFIAVPLLLAAACSPVQREEAQSDLATAAPTLEAAVEQAATEVTGELQTAAPELNAAATKVAGAMGTVAPTLEAAGAKVAGAIGTAVPTLQTAGTKVAAAVGTAAVDLDLMSSTWSWRSTQMMDDSTMAPDVPSNYTIHFAPDGTLSVKADCNMASGTYSASGSQLTIAITTSTMAMCPPDSLSDVFLAQLGDVASFVMEDGNLHLAMKVDAGIMELAPAE